MVRIYLDNCCFNRPYDDQSVTRNSLEAQAKLDIQQLIKNKKVELASSYMLDFENSENPYDMRKKAIASFLNDYAAVYVSSNQKAKIEDEARAIMQTGVKFKDACHVACSIMANCDYFLTTDKRLLKYKADRIKIINPMEFEPFEQSPTSKP